MSKFPTYKLTDKQIRGIANIVLHEQGTVAGQYAEASQIANLCELRYKGDPVKAVTSGWYANGKDRYAAGTSNKTAIEIVKRVFCDGFRTLPRYIDEHDCMSDIKSVTEGGKGVKSKKDKWVPHSTVIKNRMGSTYIFYDFPGGYKSGVDPFGYTSKENRKKFGDFCYTVEQAQKKDTGRRPDLPSVVPARGYYNLGDGYLCNRSLKPQIKLIQAFLNWYGNSLTVDGMYGQKTKKAVESFQKDMKLPVNGCFGNLCFSKAKNLKK